MMNVKELVAEATGEVFKKRRRRANKPHVVEESTPVVELVQTAVKESVEVSAKNEVKEDEINLLKAERATIPPNSPVAAPTGAQDKNYAEFLICVKNGLIACRRSRCAVKAYPIGGSLGSLTLEQLAERQGWKVTKGNEIYSELNDGKRIAWFAGEATILRRAGTNPIWADQGHVERSDHIHDTALDIVFENG